MHYFTWALIIFGPFAALAMGLADDDSRLQSAPVRRNPAQIMRAAQLSNGTLAKHKK